MQTVQLQLPEDLKSDINFIKSELKNLKENLQPKQPEEYMSRTALAKMLSVDLSSVHNYCKRGVLQSYQIAGRTGRVYFKRSEVEGAMVKLKR